MANGGNDTPANSGNDMPANGENDEPEMEVSTTGGLSHGHSKWATRVGPCDNTPDHEVVIKKFRSKSEDGSRNKKSKADTIPEEERNG